MQHAHHHVNAELFGILQVHAYKQKRPVIMAQAMAQA
jgi:hypothetical protein